MEDLKRFWLQCVCLFQFELGRLILFRGREQHSECEVPLNIALVRCRKFARCLERLRSLSCLKVRAHQVESRLDRQRSYALKTLNGRDGRSLCHEKEPQVVVCIAIRGSYAKDL